VSIGLSPEVADAVARRTYQQDADGTWHTVPTAAANISLYRSLHRLDLGPGYRAIECPLVVFRSRAEQVEDPELAPYVAAMQKGVAAQLDDLAATRDNVRLEVVDCGHMITLERPQELTTVLRDLVTGLG
jgi:pimeloyl-ACP methyl ester carboxylesterase